MLPHDTGSRVQGLAKIEQDLGFWILQTQPPGHPLESFDLVSRSGRPLGL